jgi:hypothetical protein
MTTAQISRNIKGILKRHGFSNSDYIVRTNRCMVHEMPGGYTDVTWVFPKGKSDLAPAHRCLAAAGLIVEDKGTFLSIGGES